MAIIRKDLRGEKCPFTFIHSKELIEKLKKGDILEIIIDYLPAIETIGQYAYKHNFQFEFKKIKDHIKLTISS